MIGQEDVHIPDIEERQPWIYTYGDLFTLLLCFFIIIATQEKTVVMESSKFNLPFQGGPPASPYFFNGAPLLENNHLNTIELISELNFDTDITLDDRGILVSLNSSVAFEPGSARLSEKGREVLNNFAKLLYNVPNSIIIEGHTDDIPINTAQFPSNWVLSSVRAANVAQELERVGILSDRLEVVAYAATRPKVRNLDSTSRSINRRIDILLKPDEGPN
ncbi:MAG: flagellar motor protein MotB [SAR324 cluster bacterium]|nr:flagellar motor protein MotB [SAR324 cluster bacterium]